MAFLKILIGIMTVLIVVGLIAVVWRLATLGSDDAGRLAERISLGLGPDCVIATVTSNNDLATMTVTGPGDCNAVFVVDLASGTIVSTIRP
ncbi:MAG: DUF6476 family protein [Alphaproteobacteria bacterium]|nr:DUF6476 family protein [Alphaproteobacteria bacterium]